MILDWLIVNLSAVLQIIVMASTVMAVFFGMRAEVRVLRHDVRHIEKTLDNLSESIGNLGKALTQIAVQDARIAMIEKDIDELRHGQGFVK